MGGRGGYLWKGGLDRWCGACSLAPQRIASFRIALQCLVSRCALSLSRLVTLRLWAHCCVAPPGVFRHHHKQDDRRQQRQTSNAHASMHAQAPTCICIYTWLHPATGSSLAVRSLILKATLGGLTHICGTSVRFAPSTKSGDSADSMRTCTFTALKLIHSAHSGHSLVCM